MLADFSIRLAFGLAISVLLVPLQAVPLPFFRTQAHVILGLLVLGALDQARAGGPNGSLGLVVSAAISGYLSSVAWGLGLRRFGLATAAVCALATAGWILALRAPHDAGLWAANAASRLSSGFVLGATLTAMLLGHYYLTAPSMTIDPLKRATAMIACGLGARCLLAAVGLYIALAGHVTSDIAPIDNNAVTLLAVRWGMGFVAAGISTYLAWKTAQIRSTQSATGILYITMIFVLFGELTSLVLTGQNRVIL
jgi:hypothetical protein